MIGYWFSDKEGNTQHTREHYLPAAAIGVEHRHEEKCIPCDQGLHWSPTPHTALKYANAGLYLWCVEGSDDAVPHKGDKFCGNFRRFIAGPVDVRLLLPVDVVKARARLDEAHARWEEARARLAEACARWAEASARWAEASARWDKARARLDEACARWAEACARRAEAHARWEEAHARMDAEKFNAACIAALDGRSA